MYSTYPVARVPVPQAQLFVAPDGQDRDPDLKDPDDRAAMRMISAVDYVAARDSRGQERPDWFKQPHRLYCPDCVEKGHLSRHKAVKAHDRELMTRRGERAWFTFPERFEKWPDAPEHASSCENANRYSSFEVSEAEIRAAARAARDNLITISVPTSLPVRFRAPARPRQRASYEIAEASGFDEMVKTSLDLRSYRPVNRALGSLNRIAAYVRKNYHLSGVWDAATIKTPDGARSLGEIFLNTNKDVLAFCEAQRASEDAPRHALVSLPPNGIQKFWGQRFVPSQPTGHLAVLFDARSEAEMAHLRSLFGRNSRKDGSRVLAYARVQLGADGKPHVQINRAEQIIAWDEPSTQGDLFTGANDNLLPEHPNAPAETRGRIKAGIRTEPPADLSR